MGSPPLSDLHGRIISEISPTREANGVDFCSPRFLFYAFKRYVPRRSSFHPQDHVFLHAIFSMDWTVDLFPDVIAWKMGIRLFFLPGSWRRFPYFLLF